MGKAAPGRRGLPARAGRRGGREGWRWRSTTSWRLPERPRPSAPPASRRCCGAPRARGPGGAAPRPPGGRAGAPRRRQAPDGRARLRDLLRVAQDALRDRPEIGRAVREEIDALLVDEFQDTSRVQRDLVYLLREREDAAAARGPIGPVATGDRRGAPPTPRREAPAAAGLAAHGLFLVGDRKQSIYGFRGADVAVFSRIAADLAGRAAGLALALPEEAWAGASPDDPIASFVALRESHRSEEAILAFVNAYAERDPAVTRLPAPPRAFRILPRPRRAPRPGRVHDRRPRSPAHTRARRLRPRRRHLARRRRAHRARVHGRGARGARGRGPRLLAGHRPRRRGGGHARTPARRATRTSPS